MSRIHNQLTTTITGSGTSDLPIYDGYDVFEYTSAPVTLAANYEILTTAVIPSTRRMTVTINWDCDIDVNGNTITVLGTAMPDELANQAMEIKCYWDGTAWDVKFVKGYETPALVNRSKIRTVTGSGNLADYDFVLASPGALTITLTLPQASLNTGAVIDVKKMDNVPGGKVTIKAFAGDFIELTLPSIDIITQFNSLTLQSDGTGWVLK
jgi:hypothetical protein